MKAIALTLIKAVGLSCCLLTGIAALIVVIGILVDLKEGFKDPEWMNQEKEESK